MRRRFALAARDFLLCTFGMPIVFGVLFGGIEGLVYVYAFVTEGFNPLAAAFRFDVLIGASDELFADAERYRGALLFGLMIGGGWAIFSLFQDR